MKIKIDDQLYSCTGYHAVSNEMRFTLTDGAPESLGDLVVLVRDDGFVLAELRTADFVRWYASGNVLVLTNQPEPEPMPEPMPEPLPPEPTVEEDLLTMALDHEVRISNMELGVV